MGTPVFDTEKKADTGPTRQAATAADRGAETQANVGNQAMLRQGEPAAAKNPFANVQLRKDYPISYAEKDAFVSRLVHDTFLGFERKKIVGDKSYRRLTAGGLQSYLKDIAKGDLTSFEMAFIANVWGKDGMTTLIPIYAQGLGLFGYEIVMGGSGDRVHSIVTRLGEELQVFHSEAALVSEGLGPIDYAIAGWGALSVGKFLLKRVLARAAAKAALRDLGEEGGEQLGSALGKAAAKSRFSPAEQEAIDTMVKGGVDKAAAEELMIEQRTLEWVKGPPGTKGWKPWKPMGGW